MAPRKDSGAPRYLGRSEVMAALPAGAAVDALSDALREGLEPESDPERATVELPHGQLLGRWPGHRRRIAVAGRRALNREQVLDRDRHAVQRPRRRTRRGREEVHNGVEVPTQVVSAFERDE